MLEICATKGAAPAPFSDMRTSGVPDFIFSAIWIPYYIAERQYPARKAANQRTFAYKQKPDPARFTLGPAIKQFPAIENLNLDMNHVRYAPVALVYQHNMPADHVVPKVRRWWRQSAIQVRRNVMHSRAPAGIEHESDLQARLPISRQSIFNSESHHRMRAMIAPPSIYNYALMVIERRMLPVPVMFMMLVSVTILRKRIASNKHQHRHGHER